MKSPQLSWLYATDDGEASTSIELNGPRAGGPISIIPPRKTSLFNLWSKKNTNLEQHSTIDKPDVLDDDDFKDIAQIWEASNVPAHQKAYLSQFYDTYFARANIVRSQEEKIRYLTALVAQQRQSISDLEFAMSKTQSTSPSLVETDTSPISPKSKSTDSGFDEEELLEQLQQLKTENYFLRQSVEDVLSSIGPHS